MNSSPSCSLCTFSTIHLPSPSSNVCGNITNNQSFQPLQKSSKRSTVHLTCHVCLTSLRKSKTVCCPLSIVLIMNFQLAQAFSLAKETSSTSTSGWQKGSGMAPTSLYMLSSIIWKHMFSIKSSLTTLITITINLKNSMRITMKNCQKRVNCLQKPQG